MWEPGGEGAWGRMDTCICMAKSLCCSPKTTSTLLIVSTPTQNKKFFKKKKTLGMMIIHFCVHWRGTVFLILEPQGPWKDMHIFIHTFTQVVSDTWSPPLQSHLPHLKSTTNLSIRRPLLLLLLSWFQSCPTLCDPIEGISPGSPVPGILQARTLEWVAISFSNIWKAPPSMGIFQARVLEWGAIAFSAFQPYHSGNSKNFRSSVEGPNVYFQ